MSTTFAIKVETISIEGVNEILGSQLVPIAFRHSTGNGRVGIKWLILTEFKQNLQDNVLVFPLDNSAQGVETIGDLRELDDE